MVAKAVGVFEIWLGRAPPKEEVIATTIGGTARRIG